MITGKKILFTGATGQVARPVAEQLTAAGNEVWCLARFTDAATKVALEGAGIVTVPWDMSQSDLSGVPTDFTHVMHAAVIMEFKDSETAVARTCEATGQLMTHCRKAESFLFVSSSVVYQYQTPGHLYAETDVIGGLSTPTWMPAYGATKIAAEGTVRAFAHTLGLPSTIARLSVGYGFAPGVGPMLGGLVMRYVRNMQAGDPVPTRPAGESACSLLHTDDIVRQAPFLFEAASVPATVVNWGGDEATDERRIVQRLSDLTGLPAAFAEVETSPRMVGLDPTFRKSITGACEVGWEDGLRRAVEVYYPDLVK
ncbi:MAG TPA: NAD(P)-dependent oxidoreductase [Acidimicrobiales bacterium]|jgi:nucleoside-diphosphate-sugar epimerase|nr:NAD(P)-dependent oxidoreductase [Acidimicrobiales bacterium]